MASQLRRKTDQCLYRVFMSWDGWQSQTTAVCETLSDALAWVVDDEHQVGIDADLIWRIERYRFESLVVSKT